jgi:hypothetical protein
LDSHFGCLPDKVENTF